MNCFAVSLFAASQALCTRGRPRKVKAAFSARFSRPPATGPASGFRRGGSALESWPLTFTFAYSCSTMKLATWVRIALFWSSSVLVFAQLSLFRTCRLAQIAKTAATVTIVAIVSTTRTPQIRPRDGARDVFDRPGGAPVVLPGACGSGGTAARVGGLGHPCDGSWIRSG